MLNFQRVNMNGQKVWKAVIKPKQISNLPLEEICRADFHPKMLHNPGHLRDIRSQVFLLASSCIKKDGLLKVSQKKFGSPVVTMGFNTKFSKLYSYHLSVIAGYNMWDYTSYKGC